MAQTMLEVMQQETVRLETAPVSSLNEAFVLQKQGQFSFEIRSTPSLPSAKHVIVAIKATGLCGSDIHYWQHGEIGKFKVNDPLVLGHESAGVVWKCGSEVQSLRVGDQVAIEPGFPCRTCDYCKSGRYNLCPDVQFAATPPFDGTLQRYYAVPEDFCYKIPKGVSFEEGALLEPLSVAVHCARLSNISFGCSVLVLGAGPIGLLCCAVARAFGAKEVTVVDIVQSRLDFALRFAATNAHQAKDKSPEETATEILKHCGNDNGFDVVIDATGARACISIGIHALARRGKFIQAGLGAAEIMFPIAQLCSKEATFIGSFRYGPGDFDTAMKLIDQGKIHVKDLITHRFAFEDAEAAFTNVSQRQGIKTVIFGPGVTEA